MLKQSHPPPPSLFSPTVRSPPSDAVSPEAKTRRGGGNVTKKLLPPPSPHLLPLKVMRVFHPPLAEKRRRNVGKMFINLARAPFGLSVGWGSSAGEYLLHRWGGGEEARLGDRKSSTEILLRSLFFLQSQNFLFHAGSWEAGGKKALLYLQSRHQNSYHRERSTFIFFLCEREGNARFSYCALFPLLPLSSFVAPHAFLRIS